MVSGSRIKMLRESQGLSAVELAQRIGKNKATVYRYENGSIDGMKSDVLKKIADALDTNSAYLMGWTDDSYDWNKDSEHRMDSIPDAVRKELAEKHKGDRFAIWSDWQAMERDAAHEAAKSKAAPKGFIPLPDTKSIPVIGNIACGTPILAQENIERYIGVSSLWKADFALVCKGDSMAPTIQDGDLVCIRSQPNVENGQIAAVLIDDEATLKHFYRHDDTVILQPENPRFTPMTYTKEEINNLRIEGVAVGICRGLPEYNTEC